MPPLPNTAAARRNARPTVAAAPQADPPALRHRRDHHPATRKFWDAVCASPQSGLLTEATWEWLQAKMWRFDAYWSNPIGANTALARELDDVAAKLILLPRDAAARGFTPSGQQDPAAEGKPRGAARGRRTRSSGSRQDRLLSVVDAGDAP